MFNVAILGALASAIVACRPPAVPPPPVPCTLPDDAFTKGARLKAMLSVHAHAQFPEGLPVGEHERPLRPPQRLADAAELLRCDPSPAAWSRRRRAIAKLLAYDWPGKRHRRELQILGAEIDDIVEAMHAQYGDAGLGRLRKRPDVLEVRLSNLFGGQPSLITLAGVLVHPCNKSWKPEGIPTVSDDGTSVSVMTHISFPTTLMGRDTMALNVDPQEWDQCSKFWPTPPPESTELVVVQRNGCKITGHPPVLSAPKPGDLYPPTPLYEHFVCDQAPCDSEFTNVLTAEVYHKPLILPSGTVMSHHVTYSLPICKTRQYDGFIRGRISNRPTTVNIDRGWLDVWEDPYGRTHLKAFKFVEFSGRVDTSTAGVVLPFTELNGELAEIACCLDDEP